MFSAADGTWEACQNHSGAQSRQGDFSQRESALSSSTKNPSIGVQTLMVDDSDEGDEMMKFVNQWEVWCRDVDECGFTQGQEN